jgi:UDP-N-acetylglucosamine--N-acetylmuramyl-(pentapeptide) pyrophosphoryl-undecaprenol N-acetylglucosamine transferase
MRKQAGDSRPLVLFTGGGTGGHVYPGLAVLDELTSRGMVRTAWIGSRNGMEARIVPSAGVEYHGVPSGKLRRYVSVSNLIDVFRIGAGIVKSVGLMRRLRPAILFSKGGFVSVPPVVAAAICGVPVVTHESDVDPGLATRINSRFSRTILVPYEATLDHFPPKVRQRVRVVGNPIRRDIQTGSRERGVEFLGFDADDSRPIVLFIGGSQGARQINELVERIRPSIAAEWLVAHQTGTTGLSAEGYTAVPFLGDELPDVLAAADVLVCRSGASTLWEGAILSKPMLLVPLGAGSRGDQMRNAAVFEEAGGARVFADPATLADDVAVALHRLRHDSGERIELGARARGLVNDVAHRKIADVICDYIEEGGC